MDLFVYCVCCKVAFVCLFVCCNCVYCMNKEEEQEDVVYDNAAKNEKQVSIDGGDKKLATQVSGETNEMLVEIRSVGLLSTAASTMIGEGRSYKCQKTAAPALQPKALFSYCSTIYIDATFGS